MARRATPLRAVPTGEKAVPSKRAAPVKAAPAKRASTTRRTPIRKTAPKPAAKRPAPQSKAVAAQSKPASPKRQTPAQMRTALADAVATRNDAALLVVLRQRIITAVADPKTRPRELGELTRLLMKTSGVEAKPRHVTEPPAELLEFSAWCALNDHMDGPLCQDESYRPQWQIERLNWALDHGWPGGAEDFMLCGLPDTYDPDDMWDAESI